MKVNKDVWLHVIDVGRGKLPPTIRYKLLDG